MSTRASAVKKKTVQTGRPATTTGTPEWIRSETFFLGSLLLVATVAVYLPVGHHPFVNFDDPVYVVNNPHIASGLDWDTISWSFSTFYQFNWHPVTWLSHALDVQMFRLNPAGPHVMNMLLQAANVLLLFWVLRRATGYVGRSAMVAGLFALHPINVESVAWVAERKNLLSMFFFLLGMAAYRWYASAPGESATHKIRTHRAKANHAPAPDLRRYAVMTLCFVLGLMSKPQLVTFPFVLLLWDYWPLRRMAFRPTGVSNGTQTEPLPARNFWWLVKEKVPLFAICAASSIVTLLAQKAGGAVASLQKYPFSVRLTNAIVSYVRYIGKLFWPTRLAPLYPHPWQPLPLWQVLPSLLALVVITAAIIAARRHRYLLMGWFWFLGTLVPMIGLVHVGNQAMADRYAYLPFVGLFIMVCWGVSELGESRGVPIVVLRSASLVVLAALAVVTHHQLGYWNDNVALWTHTLAVTDGNYIAHDNLAQLLMSEGQPDEAMKHYRAALAIYGSDPNSLLGIARYDQQHGNLQDAIARYQQMIRITPSGPGRAELLSNVGQLYLEMRDDASAQQSFEEVVAMNPQNIQGWLGLGVVAEQSGNVKAAIANYNRANTLKPLKVTYLLLAKALEESGDAAGAQAARERAKLLPRDEQATTQTYSGGILQK